MYLSRDKYSNLETVNEKSYPVSYKLLIKRILKELPELYEALALNFYNPFMNQCKQTKTHYILVSSAIEYFINKGA